MSTTRLADRAAAVQAAIERVEGEPRRPPSQPYDGRESRRESGRTRVWVPGAAAA